MTDEEKISRRYRELGAEEPPRALDDAILAAARNVRRSRPRSYAPLAAAAVLVLAVAVTLHMQIEQPDLQAPVPRSDRPAQPSAQPPAKSAEPRSFVPDPVPPAAPVPAPAPASGPSASGTIAGAAAERAERDVRADQSREGARAPAAAGAMAKRPQAQALSLAETPERELERIAGLRAQGRQDEADRALAEFRKRYPDYRIPEEMRLRVERR
jgi:hypothetical protein